MDPRLYIYQLRRPRVSNPTYNSSHINNSCFSIYRGGPLDISEYEKAHNNNLSSSYQQLNHKSQLKDSSTSLNPQSARSRAYSNLSNIGSNLLKMEDKDIYNKQNSRMNIINHRPVEHDETIKKYPKFSVQDKDQYYFRKMLENKNTRESQMLYNKRQKEPAPKEQRAGFQNYTNHKNKVQLNLWDSYRGSKPQITEKFTLGMLNHADEFRSIM